MLVNKTFTSTKEETPFELIWTNPNQTADFGPQIITLPDGFSAFAIEFYWGTQASYTTPAIVCIPFFEGSRFYTAIESNGYAGGVANREIKYARDGAISFGDAISFGSTANNRIVPINIWGLKFSV